MSEPGSDHAREVARAAAPIIVRRWALDALRIVSIVGVVAIHVFAGIVSNPGMHGALSWWAAVLLDIGFVWVVPVFVMISGALILDPRQHSHGPVWFYRQRLARLIPAMLVWPLFYFLVIRSMVSQVEITRSGIASFLLDGRPYTHLYFLWLIAGLYAVAPILAAFLAAGGRRRALILAGTTLAAAVITTASSSLLTALGTGRPLTLMALTQWVPYVGFFVAGWVLRDIRLKGWFLAGGIVATLALVALSVLQYGLRPQWVVLDAVAPVSYFGPLVAAAAVGIFVCTNSVWGAWQPGARIGGMIRELSASAFGVFLVHFAVMVVLRLVPPFTRADSSFWLSVLEWVVVVVISFLIVGVLRRIPVLRRVV